MICNLYVTTSENNKVVKELNLIKNVEVKLKEETDILNPALLLSRNALQNMTSANYLYLPEFKRYYYIKNIKAVLGNMIEISCRIDVLMSHAVELKNLSCVTRRQENSYNTYLNDNFFNVYNKPIMQQKAFPHGFTNDLSIILTVSGGAS